MTDLEPGSLAALWAAHRQRQWGHTASEALPAAEAGGFLGAIR